MPDPLWKNRIVSHTVEDPANLKPHPLNWRTHPTSQTQALEASLDEIGWVEEIVVNDRTGFMLNGHLRRERALVRGEKEVPVTHIDISPEEESLALTILDPMVALSGISVDKLKDLIESVQTENNALSQFIDEIAKDAGVTDLALPSPDKPAPLPQFDITGWGQLARRVIILFEDEPDQESFNKFFGLESSERVTYKWQELRGKIV